MERVSESLCFGGSQGVYAHRSSATGTPMTFQVFVPDHAEGEKLPVLWWLSGLTCTHANAMDKLEYKAACAEHRIILVGPDTSPRGDDVPDDPAYDFGKGAGFYVDATQKPWNANFRMRTYVEQELPALIAEAESKILARVDELNRDHIEERSYLATAIAGLQTLKHERGNRRNGDR